MKIKRGGLFGSSAIDTGESPTWTIGESVSREELAALREVERLATDLVDEIQEWMKEDEGNVLPREIDIGYLFLAGSLGRLKTLRAGGKKEEQ